MDFTWVGYWSVETYNYNQNRKENTLEVLFLEAFHQVNKHRIFCREVSILYVICWGGKQGGRGGEGRHTH